MPSHDTYLIVPLTNYSNTARPTVIAYNRSSFQFGKTLVNPFCLFYILCFYMLDVCCFSFLFSLHVSDSSAFTFCGVLVYVTLYCVAALLA